MSQIATAPEEIAETKIERGMTLEVVRVVEHTAIACARWVGKGSEEAADQAAVDAMRAELNKLNIDGTVVIGEGERDKAPMLYIGEKVGRGGTKVDIALDPLEGTTICATAGPNSITVLAFAENGGFLHAPDTYMEKIAVGFEVPEGLVDLDYSIEQNLRNIADFRNKEISDLRVVILNRKRHEDLIAKVRELGASIYLIEDGDVIGAIATSIPEMGVDLYLGIGGAPEGVLAAAALRCIGGYMQGRLLFNDVAQKQRAHGMGIIDLNKKYSITEMARGDIIFAATGVTDGSLLQGVHVTGKTAATNSVVMRSATGTVRYIKAYHNLSKKR